MVPHRSSGIESLSRRQKEILRLIAQHLQAKEVARQLNISERTVKTHTDAARKRLGVSTSRDAARLLVAHETAEALVPEGRWPPRTIVNPLPLLPVYPNGNEGVPNDDTSLLFERTLLSDTLARSGGGLADAGGTGQTGRDRRNPEGGPVLEPEQRVRENSVQHHSGHGLADGRRPGGFRQQLAAFSLLKWLGLIALIAVMAPLLMGGILMAVLATVEAIDRAQTYVR